jgi:uncharacterized membrane protein
MEKKIATRLLTDDHDRVKDLQARISGGRNPEETVQLAGKLFQELEIHARIEERLLYPALARRDEDEAQARAFAREHAEVRRLVSEYRLIQGDDPGLTLENQSLLTRIMGAVDDHIAREERLAFPILAADAACDEALGEDVLEMRRKLEMFPPEYRWIDVRAPLRMVYDQWTQFEEFPRFLDDIKEVRQITDARLRWTADLLGKEVAWTAEIYEQEPDYRIAWTTIEGSSHGGSVSFRALDEATTRILVEITHEPQGILEDLGALVGILGAKVGRNLEQFRKFVEVRPGETGAWRGRIESTPAQPHIQQGRRPEGRP